MLFDDYGYIYQLRHDNEIVETSKRIYEWTDGFYRVIPDDSNSRGITLYQFHCGLNESIRFTTQGLCLHDNKEYNMVEITDEDGKRHIPSSDQSFFQQEPNEYVLHKQGTHRWTGNGFYPMEVKEWVEENAPSLYYPFSQLLDHSPYEKSASITICYENEKHTIFQNQHTLFSLRTDLSDGKRNNVASFPPTIVLDWRPMYTSMFDVQLYQLTKDRSEFVLCMITSDQSKEKENVFETYFRSSWNVNTIKLSNVHSKDMFPEKHQLSFSWIYDMRVRLVMKTILLDENDIHYSIDHEQTNLDKHVIYLVSGPLNESNTYPFQRTLEQSPWRVIIQSNEDTITSNDVDIDIQHHPSEEEQADPLPDISRGKVTHAIKRYEEQKGKRDFLIRSLMFIFVLVFILLVLTSSNKQTRK